MTNHDIHSLMRPHLRPLTPYSSARSEFSGAADVFLDANENAFGSPINTAFNRYPDPLQKLVKARLSAIKNVSAEQIFLGNGSDEAIDLLIRAFCEPAQDSVLITPPTYGMYEVSADIHNVAVQRVPLVLHSKEAYTIDVERVLATTTPRTKIIFLCSPGNPTGNVFNIESIHQILRGFQGIVVVDEAYIDFAPDKSFVSQLGHYPHLAVMQTLSKAWGLAALRLGMLFATPTLIQVLNSIKPPYNINAVTQELALQALERVAWKDDVVAMTIKERERVAAALASIPIVETVYPSDANFLLVKFAPHKSPRDVYAALVRQGIIVRDRSSVPLCEGCLRITIGTHAENTRLLDTLNLIST
jgi:histidinol-phosphate aminotransferase